jgi:ferritin-like metal-binding protein YciE
MTPSTPAEELVKLLDEAYAMEKQVEQMLTSMVKTTNDPSLSSDMETHRDETKEHAERLKTCLEAHGETPSKVKEAATMAAGFIKLPLDVARTEKGMRNARDGYATEHLEIAVYRLLEEVARKAGDTQAATVARQNAEDEQRMASRIEENWAKFVALDFKEEGISS